MLIFYALIRINLAQTERTDALFLTTPAMRRQVESALAGCDVWDIIEMAVASPVLILSMEHRAASADVCRTFLADPRHLQSFLALDTQQVTGIDVLAPTENDGMRVWMVRSLQELWICTEPEHPDQSALLLEVDGAALSSSLLGTKPEDLRRTKLVFRAAH